MSGIIPKLLLCAALCLPSVTTAQGVYSSPQVVAGDNGWETYVDPLMITGDTARRLTPGADTPEAAVVQFLASRIRGDRDWQDVMTDDPGRKTKKALKAWKGWTLNAAQIKSRKMRGEDRGYVRVWVDLTIGGDNETGTDDFTVKREAGGWRISEIPS